MAHARIITAIVSIALIEGLFAFLGYPPRGDREDFPGEGAGELQLDPELGWMNRAGTFGSDTNWAGGRRATAKDEPAQNDSRPRLILVGDSYVFSSGLADADTFAWRLQQLHPELNVANYGTPGYGTYQSYLRLDHWLDDPASGSAAYYLLNGVHEARNVAGPSWIRVAKHLENGAFFPYAVLENGALKDQRSAGTQMWPGSQWSRIIATAEEYYEKGTTLPRTYNRGDVTEAILLRMEHATQLAGATFTVILFDLDPKDRAMYRGYLSARGIAFLDCDHPERNDKSLRQSDGLPNAKLNELLAGWIDRSIEAGATVAHNR